jgi:predicted nucleotidyltransferase
VTTGARELKLHLERRAAARREAAGSRAARLLERAPDAARRLRSFGATRVALFGSLAGPAPRVDSDVDLAVWGLDGAHYFEALADLMALFRAPVDLVRVEEASPSLRDRIEAEGRPL